MITRLAILLLCLSQMLIGQADFLTSNWVGRLEILGQSHFLRIQFKDGQTYLQFPYADGNTRFELADFRQESGNIQFAIERGVSSWQFVSEAMENGRLSGRIINDGVEGAFFLHQVLPLESKDWQVYLGDFKTENGYIFKIWDRFNSFRVHSPYSKEVSRMYPIGDHCFFLATGELLQFGEKGKEGYQGLTWTWEKQSVQARKAVLYKEEKQVIYTANADTIGASLFLPQGEGPFPAVLMARGAANMDRSISFTEAEIFSSYGIAVLIYDNYGTGESNGNPRTKDFADKQELVLHLFHHLQKHEKIDADQIGLMGGSQGARIAAMAASKASKPAFLILRAHPMETRKDQQLYAIGAYLRQNNVTEEKIVQVLHLWEQYFDLAHQKKTDPEYVAAVAAMRAANPGLMLPAAPANQAPAYAWPADIYNATKDYLSTITCPVLSEHGAEDDRVPPMKSIHFLREGLSKGGNEQLTVLLYPNANHSFMMTGFRIAPGLFMNEVNWIRRQLGMNSN